MTGDSLRLLLPNTETFLKSHMVYSRTEAVTVHCGQNPQNRVHMTALVLQQYLSFKHGANAHREISRDHVRWISRLENVPIWREKYARCRFRTKNGQNIFIKIIINQICITLIQTNHLLYFKYRYLIHFYQIPLYLKTTIFPHTWGEIHTKYWSFVRHNGLCKACPKLIIPSSTVYISVIERLWKCL